MKINFLRAGIVLFAVMMLAGGCSKYDEGPFISLYSKEKRVQGRWYFSVVRYNDIDSTDSYRLDPIQSIDFYLNTEREAVWNAYSWNKNSGTNGSISYGMWKFNEEMDSLTMVTTMTRYSNNTLDQDTTIYYWKINRLAYTEFWMERQEDDTTQVKWKLWKIAY